MPRANISQTNFSAGELSPRLGGRIDSAQWESGAELIQNWILEPQGDLTRRPGTRFVASAQDETAKPRLIPFIFSAGDAYMLEFGNLYIRFYQSDAQVTESLSVTGGSHAAGTTTITIGAHSAVVGDRVVVAGVTPAGYNGSFIVTAIGGTTLSYLQADPGAFVSGGTCATPFEVTTTYTTSDLAKISYTQSADVLYLFVDGFEPRKLSRAGALSWTLAVIAFLDGPYLAINASTTTITPSVFAAGAAGTFTASTSIFVSTDADDSGRVVRLRNSGANWGYGVITGFTSGTVVNMTVVKAFGDASATVDWRLGAWNATTGYPRAVTLHQQRIIGATTTLGPVNLWGSVSGDFENFSPNTLLTDTIIDADGFTYILAAGEVNKIVWLFGGRDLLVGTIGNTLQIFKDTRGGALTPLTLPEIKEVDTFGCDATARPVNIGKDLLYLQIGGRKIRLISVKIPAQAETSDVTLVAEHITIQKVTEMAYSDQPSSIVWAVKNNGELIGMTYTPAAGMAGWHRHIIGGVFGAGAAVVESIASIPTGGNYDQLWLVVKRTINSVTRRYIEYLTLPLPDEDTHADAQYTDSLFNYSGAAITVLTGLEHLEGETLEVLQDGATHPPLTVANGQITLAIPAARIIVGQGYNSDFRGLPLTNNKRLEGLQGKTKRIITASLGMYRTGVMKFGDSFSLLDEIVFRTDSDPTGQAVPLFDGEKEAEWPGLGDSETLPKIHVRADGPQPSTLLAVSVEFTSTER